MKNDKVTAEMFRKILIDEFLGDKAQLGVDYINWHTGSGYCGVTLMTTLGDYNITIVKKA